MPPAIIIIVGLIGLILMAWRRWAGSIAILVALVALFILSLPLVGKRLMIQLEAPFRAEAIALDAPVPSNIQAIVILDGGRTADAPEYGNETVSDVTLERIRYGAQLARRTGLPILVSGGSVFGERVPAAELMKRVLENEFGVKVKWVEGDSRTTLENAQRTRAILSAAGIKRVYLVTHGWHMARAQWSFANAGVNVVPAPTGFTAIGKEELSPLGYVPTTSGLSASTLALREHVGLFWYQHKHDGSGPTDAAAKPGTR